MAYTITSEHSDRTFTFSSEVAYEAALDWHNDKNNTKQKMVEFCAAHGIDISADENTLVEDWADIAMECWAANQ